MKKLILVGVLLAAAGGTALYFGLEDDKRQAAEEKKVADEALHVGVTNDTIDMLHNAKTVDDVNYVLTERYKLLPKHLQEKVGPLAKLKLAVLSFEKAEKHLDRARGLQAALAEPPGQPTPDPQNPMIMVQPPPPKIHPLAMAEFQKSVPLYESSKKEIDRLSEIKGDDRYNFLLNYSKGEIYHRYLHLFATQETAPQLLAQAVTYYKHALRHKPGDTDTVINIELLIKDSQGMGGQGQPQQQRNRLLNQQPGSGRSKGN
jgi:hypothetical protein